MGQRRVEKAVVALSAPFPGVGNSTAAEILETNPANAAKTLERHGVPFQTITVGKRPMKVYLRDDVERVARVRKRSHPATALRAVSEAGEV